VIAESKNLRWAGKSLNKVTMPYFITHINVHKMTIGVSRAVQSAVQDTIAREIKPDQSKGQKEGKLTL
jgi:hypothetical protein